MNNIAKMTSQTAPLNPQQQTVFNEIRREAESTIKANDLLMAQVKKNTSLSIEDFITEVAREQMKLEGF